MRTIDADALKKAFKKPIDGIIISDLSLIYKCIDNAPTVYPICEDKACKYRANERPQDDIRWTDKLSVTSSGDIIDFEGRVLGHINLEDVKGEE